MASAHDSAATRARLVRQLDRALATLAANHHPLVQDDVHEVRRQLKRARASLALLRPALDAAMFDRIQQRLRLAARPLSAVRDAQVVNDAFGRAVQRTGVSRRAFVGIARCLHTELAAANGTLASGRLDTASRTHVRAARRLIAAAPLTRDGGVAVLEGLRGVYRRGRKRMPAARASPQTEALHEWRKHVKRLHYALQAVESPGTAHVKRMIRQARRVGDLLGRDHDLSMLAARVDGLGATASTQRLLQQVATDRQLLQRRALRTGAMLYADRPRQFARRVRGS